MHIRQQPNVQIEFDASETNAARRLLWRLVSGHGFSANDRQGGLIAMIDGSEYRIRFQVCANGSSLLRAESPAAELLLPALAASLLHEWQHPALGPTGRRHIPRAELARRVEQLLRVADSPPADSSSDKR